MKVTEVYDKAGKVIYKKNHNPTLTYILILMQKKKRFVVSVLIDVLTEACFFSFYLVEKQLPRIVL